jgi:anthranilate/para-aminobenzoate synthase component II
MTTNLHPKGERDMENWDLFESQEAARVEWERATDEAVAELRARAEAEAAAQRHAESMLTEESEYPW